MKPKTVSVSCDFQTGLAKIQFQSFVNYHWRSGKTYEVKRGSFVERTISRIINATYPRTEYKGPRGGWLPNKDAKVIYHFGE